MDEDRENFLKLMDCYKMPKDNDEEKEIRKKAIKEYNKINGGTFSFSKRMCNIL